MSYFPTHTLIAWDSHLMAVGWRKQLWYCSKVTSHSQNIFSLLAWVHALYYSNSLFSMLSLIDSWRKSRENFHINKLFSLKAILIIGCCCVNTYHCLHSCFSKPVLVLYFSLFQWRSQLRYFLWYHVLRQRIFQHWEYHFSSKLQLFVKSRVCWAFSKDER